MRFLGFIKAQIIFGALCRKFCCAGGGSDPLPPRGVGSRERGGSRPLATLGEGKCPFFGFAWFVLTFPDCPCVPHVCSHLPCEQLHSGPIHCPAIMYQTGISSFVLCCLYNFFCSYFGNVLILVGNNRKKNQNLTESLVMWKNLWSWMKNFSQPKHSPAIFWKKPKKNQTPTHFAQIQRTNTQDLANFWQILQENRKKSIPLWIIWRIIGTHCIFHFNFTWEKPERILNFFWELQKLLKLLKLRKNCGRYFPSLFSSLLFSVLHSSRGVERGKQI